MEKSVACARCGQALYWFQACLCCAASVTIEELRDAFMKGADYEASQDVAERVEKAFQSSRKLHS